MGDRVRGGTRERRCRRRRLLAVLTVAVVGGTPVPDGKYPFMTSIQANMSKRPPYEEHFCGGTLIDRNSVLTAAAVFNFIEQAANR